MSWSTVKVSSNDKKKRLDESVDLFSFPQNEWALVRPIGGIHSYAQHWIQYKSPKKGKVNFPKTCINYNPKTQSFDDNGCPYCKIGMHPTKSFLSNFIIREEQEDQPSNLKPHTKSEKKLNKMYEDPNDWHFKDMNSKSWTPIKVIRMPVTLVKQLADLYALNKVKSKSGKIKTFEINHIKYGIDIMVKYDPDVQGPNKYSVQKEGRTSLSEEEMDYLLYDLDVIELPTAKEVQEDFKRALPNILNLPKGVDANSILAEDNSNEDDLEDDLDNSLDDDDMDDLNFDDDLDLESNEEPVKKKKKKKKKKKSSF